MDSDFRWNVLPSRSVRPQHSPADSEEEASGERQPPRPRPGPSPATRSHLPVASGPANISHCPLVGEVLWAASAEGRGASCSPLPTRWTDGQAREGRRESPSGQLEGPARPQTPRRATPSWAFHADAVNTTVQKCNKHKAAPQNPGLTTGAECGRSLWESILLDWEAASLFSGGVAQTCPDKVPEDEASCDTFGFKLRH